MAKSITARQVLDSKITEREFQDSVIELFQRYKWHICHFRPARTQEGWRTAIQGDKGFPDTLITKDGQLIIAEIKSEGGKLSPEQIDWYTLLSLVELSSDGALKVFVWRPSMWASIESIAKGE